MNFLPKQYIHMVLLISDSLINIREHTQVSPKDRNWRAKNLLVTAQVNNPGAASLAINGGQTLWIKWSLVFPSSSP